MLVILSTFSGAEMIDAEIKGRKELIAKENPTEVSSNVTIIYEFHSMAHKNPGKKLNFVNTAHDERESTKIVFEKTLNLSESELDEVLTKIERLWGVFWETDSTKEKMKILNEILQIEIEVGFLPKSFTLENINKTASKLGRLFRQYQKGNKLTSMDNETGAINKYDLLDFDDPFVGFGTAACYIAPYAQVFAYPFGQLFIEVDSWQLPIFEQTSLDFVITIFAAWMQIQISHAAAGFGWAISFLPPNHRPWIGPYYAMWGLVGGVSLTIYFKADPSAISLLDLCMWGGATNVILPFHISGL